MWSPSESGGAVHEGRRGAHAAREGRAFVTNDARIHAIAAAWLAQGRAFRMVFWTQLHHQRLSPGGFVEAFEALAASPLAFTYAIEYIKPHSAPAR